MTENSTLIQPGPVFWNVFRGAITAHGVGVTAWAKQEGLKVANLKPMATGQTNGPKSRLIRQKMMDAVGEDIFRALYIAHLRNEGMLQ